MDFTSIIGMVAAFGLMIYGMVNGHDFSVIVDNFVDIPSVYIVFGGVLGCAFAGNSLKGFLSGLKSISLIFKNPKSDEAGTIKSIIELSNLARREGLLALEESANNLEDEFMKKGIMLIVDGTDPELVRSILEAELVNVDDKHISCIESGKNFPSADLIERLATSLEVEPKDLFEFYYLQETADLKLDLISMLDKLNQDELSLAHKYVRTFLLK